MERVPDREGYGEKESLREIERVCACVCACVCVCVCVCVCSKKKNTRFVSQDKTEPHNFLRL